MSNISVICPTYRNPKYLDLFLKSAIQNRDDVNNHIIVYVDGFKEESDEVTSRWGNPDNNIYIYEEDENRGMQRALNMSVMFAKTEYVFIVNDDNVLPRNWDSRLLAQLKQAQDRLGKHIVLTVDQVEPIGPSMFNFPIKNLGTDLTTFSYDQWLHYENSIVDTTELRCDGHIFPFIVNKRYYMAVGGFDEWYDSPNVCDWDHFLKYELFDFKFPRTRAVHLYHFGSVATRKNLDSQLFMNKQQNAMFAYNHKWGHYPFNEHGTNSKVPPHGEFRGFKVQKKLSEL